MQLHAVPEGILDAEKHLLLVGATPARRQGGLHCLCSTCEATSAAGELVYGAEQLFAVFLSL